MVSQDEFLHIRFKFWAPATMYNSSVRRERRIGAEVPNWFLIDHLSFVSINCMRARLASRIKETHTTEVKRAPKSHKNANKCPTTGNQ